MQTAFLIKKKVLNLDEVKRVHLSTFDSHIENKLISGLKAGDTESFNELFRFYGKKLYFFAFGYLKSKEEAEEVVQEVFFKIWKSRKMINQDLSFKAYLFKIAYNYIQELFLKINRERAYRHEIIQSTFESSNEMEERLDYHSLLEITEKIIDQMPQRQKEILLMKRKDGMAVKEIATILDISPKTVENHLTEALKKLKEGLANEKIAGLIFFSLFIAPEK